MRGLTPNELIAWTPPLNPWIIGSDILLDQGTLGIYGAEATWKSMLSLDMAFRIATGQPWFNYPTIMNPVYAFQSEIPQTPLRKRVMKYMISNRTTTSNLWFCSELYEKIDKGWGYTELEKEIIRTQPKVLFIDPIYNSASAKLVDDYEVGLLLDRLNMLRAKYKLAIILIHHSRQEEHAEGETFHYGTDEWFGSTRFKRWLDTMIYVELVSDGDPFVSLRLNFEKTRHTEGKLPPINVEVDRRTLQFRRKELPITEVQYGQTG